MLDLASEQLRTGDTAPAREEAYFAGARLDDDELRDAAAEDEQRRAQARARHAEATRSNLGLGRDIRAGLIGPTDVQLHALREIICQLLVRHHRELIAYGAGWGGVKVSASPNMTSVGTSRSRRRVAPSLSEDALPAVTVPPSTNAAGRLGPR
jgi:hypothetical protein